MQEFNLASSEKQDEILSNFPIETGTNFLEGVFSASPGVELGGEHTLINGEGILTLIVMHRSTPASVSLTIDGDNVIRMNIGGNTTVSPFIPFRKSLKMNYQYGTNEDVSFGYLLF